MIKALFLIIKPAPTWDGIIASQRKWPWILVIHLLPLLVLTSVIEGYGLIHWGKARGATAHVQTLSLSQTLAYESMQLILSLLVVFVGARMVKALGETFHGRHTLTQAFVATAYGLSPLFLVRVFNVVPTLSPWITWAVGIVLSASILYYGLPRVMQPDPPHAFGLYLMSVIVLIMITGLACLVTTGYLQGRFFKLVALVLASPSP